MQSRTLLYWWVVHVGFLRDFVENLQKRIAHSILGLEGMWSSWVTQHSCHWPQRYLWNSYGTFSLFSILILREVKRATDPISAPLRLGSVPNMNKWNNSKSTQHMVLKIYKQIRFIILKFLNYKISHVINFLLILQNKRRSINRTCNNAPTDFFTTREWINGGAKVDV